MKNLMKQRVFFFWGGGKVGEGQPIKGKFLKRSSLLIKYKLNDFVRSINATDKGLMLFSILSTDATSQ